MLVPVAAERISRRLETPGFSSRSCRMSVAESVTALLNFFSIRLGSSSR
jgi:hypothetical protein